MKIAGRSVRTAAIVAALCTASVCGGPASAASDGEMQQIYEQCLKQDWGVFALTLDLREVCAAVADRTVQRSTEKRRSEIRADRVVDADFCDQVAGMGKVFAEDIGKGEPLSRIHAKIDAMAAPGGQVKDVSGAEAANLLKSAAAFVARHPEWSEDRAYGEVFHGCLQAKAIAHGDP